MPAETSDPQPLAAFAAKMGQRARDLVAGAVTRTAEQRAVVLRFPDIAAKLTEFPMSYARPEQWTGFIPPKWVTAPHGSGWVLNDSPSRAALLAIHAEAVERAASGGSDG